MKPMFRRVLFPSASDVSCWVWLFFACITHSYSEEFGCISLCEEQSEFIKQNSDCHILDSGKAVTDSDGPGPVQDLRVQAIAVPYDGSEINDLRESWAIFSVSWSSPQEDDREGLEGFLVRYTHRQTNLTRCHFHPYLSSPMTALTEEKKFYDACEKCSRKCGTRDGCINDHNGHYKVEVFSVPFTQRDLLYHERAFVTVTGPKPSDRNPALSTVPSCWLTDISVIYDPCSDQTRVSFLAASDFESQFTRYDIFSLGDDRIMVPSIPGQKFYDLIFEEKPHGGEEWKIRVRPVGDVCNAECPGYTLPGTCLQSATYPIQTSKSTECPSGLTTPDGVWEPTTGADGTILPPRGITPEKIIAVVIGMVVAVGLLVIIFYIVLRKKRSMNPQLSSKKRVLILYSRDYPLHDTVVNNFAIFLRDSCVCEVLIDRWNESNIAIDKSNWMSRHIEFADKVIVIISPGAERKSICYLEKRTDLEPSRVTIYNDDTFLEGYKCLKGELKKRVICVRFSYIPKYIPPLRGLDKEHELLEDMEYFLLVLHDVKKLPRSLRELVYSPISKNIHTSLPVYENINCDDGLRKKLSKSIDDMLFYVRSHPNWFNEYHGFRDYDTDTETCTTGCDSTTIDTKSENSRTELLPDVNKSLSKTGTKPKYSNPAREPSETISNTTHEAAFLNENFDKLHVKQTGAATGGLNHFRKEPSIGMQSETTSTTTADAGFLNNRFDAITRTTV